MKKAILLLGVAAICGAAQATILRVNNTIGAGAPYSDLTAAIGAAQVGDTIVVDGSSTSYGDVTIDKSLVVMGPGYWRTQNGLSAEGTNSALVQNLTISSTAETTVVRGMEVNANLRINASQVVANRCLVRGSIHLASGTTRVVVHQCFIGGLVYGNGSSYAQITNNILTRRYTDSGLYNKLIDSYIAYNTTTNDWTNIHYSDDVDCSGCTFENNIATFLRGSSANSYVGNYNQQEGEGNRIYSGLDTDLAVKNQSMSDEKRAAIDGKGAFAGNDPYAISGIPAGPVVEDVTVPVSVEQGNTLNVTVKLGIQK